MAISKQLAEMMNGQIGIESTPGKGSTFWFTAQFEKQSENLFLTPTTEPNQDTKSILLETQGHSITKPKPVDYSQNLMNAEEVRILVAEDNVINREVVIAQLENLGYTPDVVSNGREAVERLKESKFNLILMDCQMPEIDGFEATAEIRRLEGNESHTIIIALTANAIEGDREKCLIAGMDDYLSKPIKIETLRRKIEEWTISEVKKSNSSSQPSDQNLKNNLLKIVDFSILEGYRPYQQIGEPDLVNKLIDLFAVDTSTRLLLLRQALIDEDMAVLKRETHNLKGAAGNIGAFRMADICRKLEQKEASTADNFEFISQLEGKFKEIVEILGTLRRS